MYGGGVMPGPADRVRCWLLYIAESTKKGSKRFNSITKTIHFAYKVILFIYAPFTPTPLSFSSHRLLLPGPRHPSEAYTLKT